MILKLTQLEDQRVMMINAKHIVGMYEELGEWNISQHKQFPAHTKIITVNGGTWRSSDPFEEVAELWLDAIVGKS